MTGWSGGLEHFDIRSVSFRTVEKARRRVAERFNDRLALVSKVLLGLFVWVSFTKLPATPGRYDSPQSWEAVLSFAVDRHLQWGRDIVFTYGPLGFLNSDHYWGEFFWPILLWSFGFGLLWTWIFLRSWKQLLLPMRIVLLLALPFLATCPARDIGFDAVHLLAIGALGIACFPDERLKAGPLVASGIALGVLSMVKLTFFAYVIFTGVVVFGAYVSAGKIGKGTIFLASLSAAIIGGWLVTGQQFDAVGAYLSFSAEIVSGYTSAMSFPGDKLLDWGGVIIGIIMVALLLGYWRSVRQWWPAGGRISLLAAGLFLSWKEGFVRLDEHTAVYLQYCFLTAGLLPGLLRIPMRVQRSFVLLTTGAMLISSILAFQYCRNFLGAAARTTVPHAVDTIRAALMPTAFRRDLDLRLATMRNDASLPEIREAIGSASVGVLYLDQDVAILNGLNYQPHPVFQSYSAYTLSLQRLNSTFFSSEHAPQYLLWRLGQIAFRFPTLDDGEVLLQVLSSYSPVLVERNMTLWKQRAGPGQRYSFGAPREQALELEQWLDLSAEPTWAQIYIDENWWGRISSFLCRGPTVWLDVRMIDGQTGHFRFSPGNGPAGFLLNPLFFSGDDLVRAATGQAGQRQIVAMKLHADEPSRINRTIRFVSRSIEGIPALRLKPATER